MRRLAVVIAIALGTVTTARAITPQQQKMKDCNAQAAQKGLKGDERKTFMSQCLSGSAGKEAQAGPSQQQKMTDCNKDATAKGLKGAERKAFMKSCLSGK